MSQFSLKQLQKHMKFCKRCLNSTNANELCPQIKKYINQDYCRNNEVPEPSTKLESINNTSWASCISDTSAFSKQNYIATFLEKLDPINRKIIHYKIWEGKSFRKISQLVGFNSQDTSFKRFHKAIKTLKTYPPSENEFLKSFHAIREKNGQITDIEREK